MTYPNTPGYKDDTVSKENAFALMRGTRGNRAKILRAVVLELFQQGFVGTADQAGERLGISPFSVRPRCTELRQMQKLERVKIHKFGGVSAWSLRAKP